MSAFSASLQKLQTSSTCRSISSLQSLLFLIKHYEVPLTAFNLANMDFTWHFSSPLNILYYVSSILYWLKSFIHCYSGFLRNRLIQKRERAWVFMCHWKLSYLLIEQIFTNKYFMVKSMHVCHYKEKKVAGRENRRNCVASP